MNSYFDSNIQWTVLERRVQGKVFTTNSDEPKPELGTLTL
jgi:hypothetical protein